MNNLERFNEYLNRCFNKSHTWDTALKTSDVDNEVNTLITRTIPHELKFYLNDERYIIYGSIGKGLATKTPWIAILDKNITSSTREGVYLVFLFSSDFKSIYLTLNQGTTVPGQFGPRLKKKDIINNSKRLRELINIKHEQLITDNNADIADERYKEGAIYYSLWDTNNAENGKEILELYLNIYRKYKILMNIDDATIKKQNDDPAQTIKSDISISTIISLIEQTGLIFPKTLIKRFTYSLLTKPFLILSGLSGSGKTQLALSFAKTLCEDIDKQLCFVPVGADWTNREPLLGYPNALREKEYILPDTQVLQLILRASKDEARPYFLILDEMNLSYVERYFADFLSVMEAKDMEMKLWDVEGQEVPKSIALPKNLFIIGTINVDETTYMFSPKVLDRANVIEFKVSENEMNVFLEKSPHVNAEAANGMAANMAKNFVQLAIKPIETKTSDIKNILMSFFTNLKKENAEFGYRSATEIARFIALATANNDLSMTDAIDAAIVQKLLPKLHGSQKKLEDVLKALWTLCMEKDNEVTLEQKYYDPKLEENALYKLSADKIFRMYKTMIRNGFTSFAEA